MSTVNDSKRLSMETAYDLMEFERATGKLVSLRSKIMPDNELLCVEGDDPAFVIQYLDSERQFRQISSLQAKRVELHYKQDQNDDSTILTFEFHNLDDLDLSATIVVKSSIHDRFSYWTLSLNNEADLIITDVQFPFIVLPYNLGGTPETEYLVRPYSMGQLYKSPKPNEFEQDTPHAWQFHPENGDCNHYPGLTFAQFLAYYNDQVGVYISCLDSSGKIKLIKPVNHKNGLRLGIAHVGDWQKGVTDLGYNLAIGSFKGDWYDATDLYREWSLDQNWANPLYKRDDVPEWLLESPPHIILRIQGELDDGPTEPNEEFLPYPKCVPLLERLSNRINAPLVPVIMSWERPGPWIYPDCFPPAGGEESLSEFSELARERDWHIGTFCNGTRWVTGHRWSGYKGDEYFKEKNGQISVCRTHTQAIWNEGWDDGWRPSYACCLGTDMTKDIAEDFVRKIVGMGLDWIQFLDQNVGCATFPCYSVDHGHPSVPGKWMTEEMHNLMDRFYKIAESEYERTQGKRQIIFSVECPINEYFIPRFQICDVRVIPTGHYPTMRPATIPLYHYLYHELILIQGGFGYGPEPYHLPIRNAYNLVVGEIPGAVMKGDGVLLNVDTGNWAPWEPQVGSNDDAVQVLKSATALRRAKNEFLVYGRMLKPSDVQNINMISWQNEGKEHNIPSVFHTTWQAPDERTGIVIGNWTTETQEVIVNDSRFRNKALLTMSSDEVKSDELSAQDGSFKIVIPKLSFVLLESII
jgi:hypothetical protein